MTGQFYIVKSIDQVEDILKRELGQGRHFPFRLTLEEEGTDAPRTDQQRKAIEVFCREQAKHMNDSGFTQRKFFAALKQGVDLDWTQEAVKENLWRVFQKAMLKTHSTTKIKPEHVNVVYEQLVKSLGDMGVEVVPFPSRYGESMEWL